MIASDDSIQVSLGPCPVLVHNEGRGYGGAGSIQNAEAVTIPPGPSRVMVKVFEGTGGWGYRLRFTDLDGNPLTPTSDPALQLALDPKTFELTELIEESCLRAEITVDPLTPTCGIAPVTVSLDGLSSFSRAEITDYEWDWGDGETDTADTVMHTYEDPGLYTVTLTVKDDTGAEDSTTITVNVFVQEVGFECNPVPDNATLAWAFAFGASSFTCPTYNDDSVGYTKVSQSVLGLLGIAYDPFRGWGYEVTRPGSTVANGWGIYGPFDDSSNNRGDYAGGNDTCHEELYDQFIGAKDFTNTCMESPCPSVPGTDDPEGIHFRIDMEDGLYRFVGAIGDPDNVHAHTIIVENGGEGEEIDTDEAVVLVQDFDQAQWCQGQTEAAEPGEGVYARVGFNCRIPPLGDGTAPDPQFVKMDENGQPTFDPPNSPTLEVNQGYIRVHQLQGASNDGPGGPRDPNGGDMVILEIWKVEEGPVEGGPQFVRGDADSSNAINLTDGINILNWLFLGGPVPGCLDAADTDDNGGVDLTDAVKIFNWLFTGGPPPAAPSPDTADYDPAGCGEDTTPDKDGVDLTCVQTATRCPQP